MLGNRFFVVVVVGLLSRTVLAKSEHPRRLGVCQLEHKTKQKR